MNASRSGRSAGKCTCGARRRSAVKIRRAMNGSWPAESAGADPAATEARASDGAAGCHQGTPALMLRAALSEVGVVMVSKAGANTRNPRASNEDTRMGEDLARRERNQHSLK